MSVLDRAAERCAKQDRAFPKVPGLAASQLQGEMSTGPNRLKDGKTLSQATAHAATSSRRFGVKPSSGKVSDLYAGVTRPGHDDGSDYFAEWRENGGVVPMPKPKTPSQDRLKRLCVAWIAGERGDDIASVIRNAITGIIRTDPKHGAQWRTAMVAAGLKFN